MAITTSPAGTQVILENNGDSVSEDMIQIERIEHIGGKVGYFFDCRNWEGEGPEILLSQQDAEALHAWLGKQLGK